MATPVQIEMPVKPVIIPDDTYQWGFYSAYQDVALGNQPHPKRSTYGWTDQEFARGYRDAVGDALRAKNDVLGIKPYYGGNDGFNCMAVYGGG